jgi:hypothetical protein
VIRFAAETTPAGCDRVTCTDIAPENGKAATFRVRQS